MVSMKLRELILNYICVISCCNRITDYIDLHALFSQGPWDQEGG